MPENAKLTCIAAEFCTNYLSLFQCISCRLVFALIANITQTPCCRTLTYFGFLSTRMTESPLIKSLGMKRSLLTGVEPFFPLPVLGICSTRWEYVKRFPAAEWYTTKALKDA